MNLCEPSSDGLNSSSRGSTQACDPGDACRITSVETYDVLSLSVGTQKVLKRVERMAVMCLHRRNGGGIYVDKH
jgi:hypothetical protein